MKRSESQVDELHDFRTVATKIFMAPEYFDYTQPIYKLLSIWWEKQIKAKLQQ